MTMMKSLVFSFLFCITLLAPLEAKEYELKELISLISNHPEVRIENAEVEKAETLIEKINGESRPKISIMAGLGPNYSEKGNALSSTRSEKLNDMTYLADIKVQIPLFAFGRAGDLKDAARGNIEVKKIAVDAKKAELVKKVKEYYYGFQYTSSLHHFASGTLEDLDRAILDFEKSKKSKKENSNQQDDLDKLTIFRSLAQTKVFQIQKGISQALLGLRYVTQDESPTIAQDWIEYNAKEIPSLSDLKSNLSTTHFDLRKVNLGINAQESLYTSEKKAKLPVFGIFAQADLRHSQKSEKQKSSFAYDPYNRSDVSVGLGFIWDIDFGSKNSVVNSALIELNTLKVKKDFALKNLPIKVELLYLDLEEAKKKIEELEKSYKTTKRMVTRVGTGIALGLTPAKDIIESYTMKAEIYQQLQEAIYNYELKLSELSYEVGIELDPTLS